MEKLTGQGFNERGLQAKCLKKYRKSSNEPVGIAPNEARYDFLLRQTDSSIEAQIKIIEI